MPYTKCGNTAISSILFTRVEFRSLLMQVELVILPRSNISETPPDQQNQQPPPPPPPPPQQNQDASEEQKEDEEEKEEEDQEVYLPRKPA